MVDGPSGLTVENRLLGAIAHGGIMAQGIGILVGIIIYHNQRDKSRYVAFQGLQAAVFQLIALGIIIASWVIWTILYLVSFIPLIPMMEAAPPDAPPPALFWIGLFSMIIPFAIMGVLTLMGLWGALQTWRGREFRYPIVGRWLENSGLWNGKSDQAA